MIPVVTPIYLNEEDSKKFLLFMENYEVFNRIIESGCLQIRAGSCIIHFDSQGTVRLIEKNTTIKF